MKEVTVSPLNQLKGRVQESFRGRALENTDQSSAIIQELYSQYVEKVYRYIFMSVGNRQAAEDLTSDTFLAVIEDLDRFRGEGSLLSWIYGIAHHKIIDYFRTRSSATSFEDINEYPSSERPHAEIAEQNWQL